MTIQLAIEIYAIASLCMLSAVAALFLKAYWPAPEVRTLARPQLNALLEAPLRADGSEPDYEYDVSRSLGDRIRSEIAASPVRQELNVNPVTPQELSEIDQMIDALLTLEPRPTPLARMKPASKRVM